MTIFSAHTMPAKELTECASAMIEAVRNFSGLKPMHHKLCAPFRGSIPFGIIALSPIGLKQQAAAWRLCAQPIREQIIEMLCSQNGKPFAQMIHVQLSDFFNNHFTNRLEAALPDEQTVFEHNGCMVWDELFQNQKEKFYPLARESITQKMIPQDTPGAIRLILEGYFTNSIVHMLHLASAFSILNQEEPIREISAFFHQTVGRGWIPTGIMKNGALGLITSSYTCGHVTEKLPIKYEGISPKTMPF